MIVIDSLRIEPSFVEIRVHAKLNSQRCPNCSCPSSRVHSRYERNVRDLPWRGTPVKIRLLTRRFFCDHPLCRRKIFSEQIEELAKRWAQSTPRFDQELIDIGLEAGGAPGARLARKLGSVTSGSSILRRLRSMPPVSPPETTVAIGIDDFAFRRGTTYGTIIVDHVTGRPIDLLSQRESRAVENWLSVRPPAQFVTRDRSGCYGSAVTKALPDAVQIADRWHLLANARTALANMLGRMQPTIRAVAARLAPPPSESVTNMGATMPPTPAKPMAKEQQLSHDRRLRRIAKYERVLELIKEGKSQRAVGRMLAMSEGTVGKYLRAGCFIERSKSVTHSLIDPYAKTVRAWWDAGDHNAKSLFRRLKPEGFTGSFDIVRRFVSSWRTPEERERTGGPRVANPGNRPFRPPMPSGNQLSWLLIDDQIERTEIEAKLIAMLLAEVEPIKLARDAVLTFNAAIRERDKARLEAWTTQVQVETMPQELRSFARGIDRDWPEVSAAIEHAYSNGRTEGHVNRLKLIKRKMYGRANFDLLRIRVLASGP